MDHPKDAADVVLKTAILSKSLTREVSSCAGRAYGSAYVPRVIYVDHGARHDPIIDDVDRGGAINTIAPNGITSKNAVGQATSGYLVDVQKLAESDYRNGARRLGSIR